MKNRTVAFARLRTGEMGRTLADIYDADGMRVDRITGNSRPDCLQSLAIQYPHIKVLDHDGTKLRLYKPSAIMRDPQEGTQSSMLDRTVSAILVEIQNDRYAGKLRPFVEGEPIGTIPLEHRKDVQNGNHLPRVHKRKRKSKSTQ